MIKEKLNLDDKDIKSSAGAVGGTGTTVIAKGGIGGTVAGTSGLWGESGIEETHECIKIFRRLLNTLEDNLNGTNSDFKIRAIAIIGCLSKCANTVLEAMEPMGRTNIYKNGIIDVCNHKKND